MRRTAKTETLQVHCYRFSDVHWRERPYEGHHPARFRADEIVEKRVFPAGSVVVPMNQPLAKVAAHILEPMGPDPYVSWGFFDTIFEQKEYAESYVLEKLARKMLAKDPDLRSRFEKKKATDPQFANNPREILNRFYRQSPYWDRRLNVYPVGKIFEKEQPNLLF